jgi:hypothetical protein
MIASALITKLRLKARKTFEQSVAAAAKPGLRGEAWHIVHIHAVQARLETTTDE